MKMLNVKGLIILLIMSFWSFGCQNEDHNNADQQYIANRSPLRQNPYIELPLGSIKAEGWLEEMLLRQKHGSTGNLDELWPEIMGENNGWLGGDGDQWERGPYWIHGLLSLAYTLDDQELIDKTEPWIEWMLNSQKESGYFGPDQDYPDLPGIQRSNSADWWPRMVVLKILKNYYNATGDQRVTDLMTNYFRYQLETLPEKPLDNWTFWARFRGGDNLMIVYWLYNITGDAFLLDLAEIIHEQTFNYTEKFLHSDLIASKDNIHCVNLAQGIKEPAVYYQHNPDPKYIEAIKTGFSDLKMFSGQPQGMYGGDEALRDSDPTHGVELCSVVELMFSLETILGITGDVQFADHLEKVAFNALPTQISDDFMYRQYFQQANQVMVSKHDKNFSVNHHGLGNVYGFLTGYPCCTANKHQGWPLLTQHLWWATPDGGLAALIYAPSTVSAKVAGGTEVVIKEETNYPFEDNISFTISFPDEDQVSFPFDLRIPEWCAEAIVKINGEVVARPEGNQMYRISREWNNNDIVELELPAEIELIRGHERSVSVNRGPLVFALKVEGEKQKMHNTRNPEYQGDYYYQIMPTGPWNYGLMDVAEEDINEAYKFVRKDEVAPFPWNPENAPVYIETSGKRITTWKIYNETAGPLPYSIQWGQPVAPEEEVLRLIPYGSSDLRISAFPLVGSYSIMQ